jgi:sugar fermentation stimulation protein A
VGSYIELDGRLRRGVFLARPNRFLAQVQVNDAVVPCFIPNPGRMYELFSPGAAVLLRDVEVTRHRKTAYDLIGVLHGEEMVSIDTRVPNRLVREALDNGDLPELAGYQGIQPEYRYSHSRLDFLLTRDEARCLVEVKSCTLVEDGVARFPDAPTARGRRHLADLITAKQEGMRACVLFVVQREDAQWFTPNDATDPAFGMMLRRAVQEGIEAYAYLAPLVGHTITLNGRIEVVLT